MKKILLLTLAFSAFAFASEPQKSDDKIVTSAVCPDKETHRFEKPLVSLSMFDATDGLRAAIMACVDDFNHMASGLTQIVIVEDSNDKADIVVRFITPADTVFRCKVRSTYERTGEIKQSDISVTVTSPIDYPKSQAADGFYCLYPLLVKGMGFNVPDQPLELDSFFWGRAAMNSPTDFDKKVIRFLYEKAPTGTPKFKVASLARKEFK